ncbi:MAG TPA: hypothetical protein VJZ51_05585 [Bacilli bacterium]|nr:hypothetical protein [Bacilli bacterium]
MLMLKKPASNLGLNAKEAQKIMMAFEDFIDTREENKYDGETLFTETLGIDLELAIELETVDGVEYEITDVWRLAAENAGKNY